MTLTRRATCSRPDCSDPAKSSTGYCRRHHAEYMVRWRAEQAAWRKRMRELEEQIGTDKPEEVAS